MTEYRPPCQNSETPDDWFIESDGKQYPDDMLVTIPEREAIRVEILANATSYVDPEEAVKAAIEVAHARKVKASLIRRRHARDTCHTECYMRLQCLSVGLDVPYGIWGGYTREERKQIVQLRDEKEAARHV